MTKLNQCPGERTFKMTAQEVTDLILGCLDNNHESEVIEVELPEKGERTLNVELSCGLFLDEANRIADVFDDENRQMLIFSTEVDDNILLCLRPGDRFWNKEGGAK